MRYLVPLPVLLPLFAVGVKFLLGPRRSRVQNYISLSVLLADTVISTILLIEADRHGPIVVQVGSFSAPLGISLVVDRFSGLMLAISSAVTLCVLVYSQSQRSADENEVETGAPLAVFYPTYLVLAAGIADSFLAGDLFNLYVGFEVMLTASYVLMTIGGTDARIRHGAVYIMVGAASSLLFVAAIAVAYAACGTVNLADLAVRLAGVAPAARLAVQLLLITVFAVKAAVFPLSAWLPDSYPTAPAPVTAVFAGLLTKVGVYSLIRVQTLLFPHERQAPLLYTVAALSMIIGILGAVAQADLKRLLSFTLVSHVGFLVLGLAIGSVRALSGALFYAITHITVQTSLFLVTGLIERREGTADFGRLAGLARLAPVLGVLYFIPAMNLAGIPPLSGFLAKFALLQAAAEDGGVGAYLMIAAMLLTSLLTLYAMTKVWARAFWRTPGDGLGKARERQIVLPGSSTAVVIRSTVGGARGIGGRRISTSESYPIGMLGVTVALILLSLAYTVWAGPIADFTQRAAAELLDPSAYIDAVRAASAASGGAH
jgi:multicomponent Na+:H+ antiporter subunit D